MNGTRKEEIVTDKTCQLDIGSAHSVNSPKYLICVHQTATGSNPPNKRRNYSFFDNLNVRKYFVEVDGLRFPRDGVLTNYDLNFYIDQYRDLKLFIKNMLVKNY